MYLATGRGANKYVPDGEAQAIIDRMKPLLRNNQVADAVEQGVSDVLRVLNGEHFEQLREFEWHSYIFPGGFVFILVALAVLNARRESRYKKVKRVLTEIEQQAARAKADRYEVESCAICLETFKDAPQPTRVLACGHTFHAACLKDWEQGTCPICRAPDVESATFPDTPRRPGARTARNVNARGLDSFGSAADEDFGEEYRFRLRRTRALYPDVVTDSMVHRWTGVGPCNARLTSDVAFVRAAPGYDDGSRSSGGGYGGGGHSSYGGGCSGGGGGAGGGW